MNTDPKGHTMTYQATTADGISYLVDGDDARDAARAARAHLRDNLTHINPCQSIAVTPVLPHGIAWHRD